MSLKLQVLLLVGWVTSVTKAQNQEKVWPFLKRLLLLGTCCDVRGPSIRGPAAYRRCSWKMEPLDNPDTPGLSRGKFGQRVASNAR